MEFLIPKEYSNKSGIYKISNSINSKLYFGSAIVLKSRFNGHVSDLLNKKHNKRLQNFVNKYGIGVLSFELVELVDIKEKLIEREQFYLDAFKTYKSKLGFNICPTAGSILGIKMPKSHREACRKRMIGNTIMLNRNHTDETKIKCSIASKKRKWTQEQKDAVGNSKRGIKIWENNSHPMLGKKGKLNPRFGKKLSKEACQNIANGKMGNKNPNFGKKMSDEQKNKIRKANGKQTHQYDLNGNFIKIWDSARQAAKELGFDSSSISKVCRGELTDYKGYKWKIIC